ncbi:hypothetical protein [Actinomyces sp. Z5]|nr:hypothetical protein [Actinomyces sp. Z5]
MRELVGRYALDAFISAGGVGWLTWSHLADAHYEKRYQGRMGGDQR